MTWRKRHPPNFTKMLSIKNATILHIWSAVYRLSPPGLMVSMKYPFPLVILMWVYLLLPFLLLNELCISAVIRDLSRLCGIDVYKVEKSYVWTDVAVRTSRWSRDDNRLVEFLTIHMLLTPLRLVLVLLYLISPSFTVVNTLVSRHDKPFVVHLLEPAIKRCLTGTLCNFVKWHNFAE